MHKIEILNKIIKYKKPITIEKFIELCLYETKGYYKNSNVIGKEGDFTTAPEISQLFGDTIGLFIKQCWTDKKFKSFNLIELGPGKGTLISDIMRVTKKYLDFNKSLNIFLIEKNKNLINQQKKLLININNINKKIVWLDRLKFINNNPSIIIANEFFDCFPIRQFYKKNNIWFEKMIEFDTHNQFLKYKDTEIKDNQTLSYIKFYKPNDILEVSKLRENYFLTACKYLNSFGGIMIIFDYGYFDRPKNFTLQSIFNNKYSNILDNIGCQDITSLVDFRSLIDIAKKNKLKIDFFNSQRKFLINNGISEITKKLIKNCNKKQADMIKIGLNRIIDKNNMGTLFKVLVVSK